uniref:Uncharacterized protein n=1 Tax=Panagrolaimus superbus TaxID=310955 RepID=A0A914XU23_9BILA
MMEQKKEIMPPLQEVSAKGDDDDEIEEAIDVKKLNEAEKCAEKVQQIGNKKDAVTAAHADNIDTEEEDAEKKKQEKFVKDKIECVKKVKEMFEVPEWDKKHMPADCDYKLFMASSSMLRFCIMEYLKAHADQILISHGYKILDGRAEVPRTAFEWLRSSEITENDEFLKSRAWMLENWSTFKRSPSLEWSYYSNMEVPLLYMTSMKDCITESEVLDRVLRQTLQTAAEYFTVTPKKDWQLQDHPMKVLARIFEDGKTIDLAATSVSVENGEVKN